MAAVHLGVRRPRWASSSTRTGQWVSIADGHNGKPIDVGCRTATDRDGAYSAAKDERADRPASGANRDVGRRRRRPRARCVPARSTASTARTSSPAAASRSGALIAAIALGVVLTYRGSGVVNFANGAIAMYIAYVYAGCARDGDLFLPPLPNPLALVEGVVHRFSRVRRSSSRHPDRRSRSGRACRSGRRSSSRSRSACCSGSLLHFLIFRPLRNAPPLAKVVASVGLLLSCRRSSSAASARRREPCGRCPFVKNDAGQPRASSKINQEQLFVALLVIVFAFALWVLFQRTRFGLATRAAAENEKGAVVLGFSPDFLAGTNWVLSTVITGLLGIFVASINSTIDPIVIPRSIVPALTAALVGSFSSFGCTTLAAFVLGMQVPLIAVPRREQELVPEVGRPAVARRRAPPAGPRHRPRAVRRGRRACRRVARSPRAGCRSRRRRRSGRLRYGGPALAVRRRGSRACSCSAPTTAARLAEHAGRHHHLPVGRGDHRLRRPDLARADGVRRHLRVLGLAPLARSTDWPFPWPIFAGARSPPPRVGLLVALPALARARRQPRDRHVRVRGRGRRRRVPEQQRQRRLQRRAGEGSELGQPEPPGEYHFLGITIGDGPSTESDDRDLLPHRRASSCAISSRTCAARPPDARCSPCVRTNAPRRPPASTCRAPRCSRSRSRRSSPASAAP